MNDRAFGMVIVAIFLFFAWGSSLTRESFIQDPLGPKVFPYVLAGFGVIFGVAISLRPDENPSWPARHGWLEIIAAIMAMFAYAYLLPLLGFVIITVVGAGYFAWRFGATPIQAVITGGSIALGLYLVFHLILGLSLAKGPFGF